MEHECTIEDLKSQIEDFAAFKISQNEILSAATKTNEELQARIQAGTPNRVSPYRVPVGVLKNEATSETAKTAPTIFLFFVQSPALQIVTALHHSPSLVAEVASRRNQNHLCITPLLWSPK